MNPTQLLTPPVNLKIGCRIQAPFLRTHSPRPTINLPRIQIFNTGIRKLSILLKLWEWRKWQGGEGSTCLSHYDALRAKIDMWLTLIWYGKTRVTSSNPRVTGSNSRVMSSNPRVTSSNPRVTSSNPLVMSSNPRESLDQWKLQ